MRLIGRDEQQATDRLWQERTGLPLLLLMEAAAAAVSRICLDLVKNNHPDDRNVLVLAGKGQNGGDAFACARQLVAAGCRVTCRELFPTDSLPAEAAANRQAAISLGLGLGLPRPDDFASLGAGSLIVDGIFGTGLRADRPLPPVVGEAGERAAAARLRGARVVAIDVPSGLDANSGAIAAGALHADVTVTFVRAKVGLLAAPGRFLAGNIVVDPIGIPEAWVDEAIDQLRSTAGAPDTRLITADDILACKPERPADSHKGNFGRVLVLGGAPGMPGAAMLASEAAARSGAGLLTIAVPASIGPLVLAALPEGLLHLLPDDGDAAQTEALIRRLIAGQPAVTAGPGAGRADWLAAALPLLISQAEHLLLDADALNFIAAHTDVYFPLLRARAGLGLPPAILTPHPGEFRRLLPDCSLSDRQAAARQLAMASGCVAVLKGASTVVAEPGGIAWINPTGNDGLARGGSGDVLCGLMAGLMAQGLPPSTAATAGVYLHGKAADLAACRLGRRAMLPRDVIAALGETFRAAGWE
jgi:ADP-dependent NAD(P)H-hydrate dehydratase / NAD(P)H-hydrate epimerase